MLFVRPSKRYGGRYRVKESCVPSTGLGSISTPGLSSAGEMSGKSSNEDLMKSIPSKGLSRSFLAKQPISWGTQTHPSTDVDALKNYI